MAAEFQSYPMVCLPVLKSKIWGGRKMEDLFEIPLPRESQIGEAWLVADLKEGASTITNGPYAGKTLSEVTSIGGYSLIGTAWEKAPTGKRFPLLIKLLDAQDDLSIQVHPDHDDCQKYFPLEHSKDESWIIVQTDEGGTILHGFEPGTTLTSFDVLIAQNKVVECLRRVKVNPGEVYRVAPGTVHALCRGVVILEIQEPSDTTFRIYDYNRPGDDGKPRELHLDQSRKVMKFGDDEPPRKIPFAYPMEWGIQELLIDVPAYRIERITCVVPMTWNVNPASVQCLIIQEGHGYLRSNNDSYSLRVGDCVILPANSGTIELTPKNSTLVAIVAGAGNVPMIQ